MTSDQDDLIKHREISFCTLHPDPDQAQSALLMMGDVQGITHLSLLDRHRLQVSYDIRKLSLRILEEALVDVGFHLDNTLMTKLKRALYYYTEDIQRENLGCSAGQSNCTEVVFVNRYERLKHGCRDERPSYWRRYL